MFPLELDAIREALRELCESDPNHEMFGAGGHKYELHPTMPIEEITRFEEKHEIKLPDDYRIFLTQLGNGGAGPYYGVFRLGERDEDFDHAPWEQGDGFVGILADPFPHTQAWNDLEGLPGEEIEEDDEAYDEAIEAFEEKYYAADRMNGAIPICHQGCAIRSWLVVSGEEKGHVWIDARADHEGIFPDSDEGKPRLSFGEWYCQWIRESLAETRG
ncbi:MAG: SMI1/KNR4 family protein [Deltaproteobacteria bacterium]|nr:SMI1/KNR4 family protein [Deltaproteobacteria bacterium]